MKDLYDDKTVYSCPQECFDALIKRLSKTYSEEELANVRKAYEIAAEAHSEQKRLSGEPYIMHPLNVALILSKLGMDDASVIAAILHDTVEDTIMTYNDVKSTFGQTVADLVEGVTKIGKVPLQTKEEQQAENIRKMLLAMSRDIRVIIIKLADRLHNMRTLMFKPEQRRREIALETIEIYAPIAHRLGIRPIKEELEDLSISYLDPVAYHEIEENLEAQSRSRNEYLADILRKRAYERWKTESPTSAKALVLPRIPRESKAFRPLLQSAYRDAYRRESRVFQMQEGGHTLRKRKDGF
jgi:GTP pyrophosphokinase